MKVCSVCGRNLEKSEIGRLRIAKRKSKGEDIAWVCSACAEKMTFAEGKDGD